MRLQEQFNCIASDLAVAYRELELLICLVIRRVLAKQLLITVPRGSSRVFQSIFANRNLDLDRLAGLYEDTDNALTSAPLLELNEKVPIIIASNDGEWRETLARTIWE